METEPKGMTPTRAGGMLRPCLKCRGEGKFTWKDVNGDVKEKVCPRCHGSRVEEVGRGYQTK
jgi:DnaJ-class molecular chaperone